MNNNFKVFLTVMIAAILVLAISNLFLVKVPAGSADIETSITPFEAIYEMINDIITPFEAIDEIIDDIITAKDIDANTFLVDKMCADAVRLVTYKHDGQIIDDIIYIQEIPIDNSSSGAFDCSPRLYNMVKAREFIYDDSANMTMWCKADSSGIVYHKIVFYENPKEYESSSN